MALRTDLDGLRVRMPGSDAVYLIDQGRKRWISNGEVYERLFRNWDNIHLDLHLDQIDTGPDLPLGTMLIRFGSNPAVFLAEGRSANDPGWLRWIASGAVMDRYQFAWSKIQWWPSCPGGQPYAGGPDALRKEGRPD